MSLRTSALAVGRARCWPDLVGVRRRLPGADRRRPPGRPVVASTNVYGSIANAVGGDRVPVDVADRRPGRRPALATRAPRPDAAAVGRRRRRRLQRRRLRRLRCRSWSSRPAAHASRDRRRRAVRACDRRRDGVQRARLVQPADDAEAGRPSSPPSSARPTRPNAAAYTANADAFTAQVDGPEGQGRGDQAGAPRAPGWRSPSRCRATSIEAAGLVDATPAGVRRGGRGGHRPAGGRRRSRRSQLFAADPVLALVVNAQTETPTTDQVRQAARDRRGARRGGHRDAARRRRATT